VDRMRLAIVALVIAAIATLSLLWLAGESHYQSCVEKIEARYPATKQVKLGSIPGGGQREGLFENPAPIFKDVPNPQRAERLPNCSRLPF